MVQQTFKEFLDEETAAADIAPVDNKLNTGVEKRRCKEHNRENCEACLEE